MMKENDKLLILKEFTSNSISISQFAKKAGITRRTVYNRLKAGTAPRPIQMPDGRIYFFRDEALKYADE